MLFDTASDRYRTVARYDTALEAHLAAGRLQTEGIDAVIADEHYVTINWMMAGALGGVKIRVPAEQAEAAAAVLAQLQAGEFALSAVSDTGDSPAIEPLSAHTPNAPAPAPDPHCPRCDGIAQPHRGWRWRLSMLLVHAFTLPVPFKEKQAWRCAECGKRWRTQE